MRAVKGEHAVCVSLCGLAGYGAGGTDSIYEISEYHGLVMSIQKWGISCLFALVLYEFDDLSLEHTSNSLKFVLHIADDLAIEEVDDALGASGVFLRVGHHHDGCAFFVELSEKVHDFLAVL